MRPPSDRRLALLGLGAALLLIGVFTALVLHYGRELRGQIRAKMIERDAAVLYPIVRQQIQDAPHSGTAATPSATLLAALRPDSRREGFLAMAIFDEDGVALEQVPSNQLLVELPVEDFFTLQNGRPLTRFFPRFALNRIFPHLSPSPPAPVLEIILPLNRAEPAADRRADRTGHLVGFVRYHLDARALDRELASLDQTVLRTTLFTLAVGIFSIATIVTAAWLILRRAQRLIAQRNAQLVRTNFELTLAAKASALGQIASHLIHGLQGPVAGLRAMVSGHEKTDTADWSTAADYTERMQSMIQEAVALLGDTASATAYELTGHELADLVRRRNAPAADRERVALEVAGGFDRPLDSHRGSLLCLIVNNLVENALHASAPGQTVRVVFRPAADRIAVHVSDEGAGIPDTLRPHLFEPGRSGRAGGSGLGLAISQLLARQIGATLELESTGPQGTTFRLTLPLDT